MSNLLSLDPYISNVLDFTSLLVKIQVCEITACSGFAYCNCDMNRSFRVTSMTVGTHLNYHETNKVRPIDINNSRLGKVLGKLSELIMGNPHDVKPLRCTPGMGALQLVLWSEPFW